MGLTRWCAVACVVALSSGQVFAAPSRAASLTVVLRDDAIRPSTISVDSGEPVRLALVNRGRVDHEFEIYTAPRAIPRDWPAYVAANTYFQHLGEIDVAVPGQDEVEAGMVVRIHVAPRAQVIVYFTPRRRGIFEMADHDPGHYERGMKGTLIVR